MKIRSAAIAITFFCASFVSAEIGVLVDFGTIENYPESSHQDKYTKEVIKVISAGDFLLDKWRIELASSSRTAKNMEFSFTKAVDSRNLGRVLGVRVHFPTSRFNSWAKIKPPYPIEAFSGESGDANENKGILRNVRVIKTIEVRARGRNFKHNLTLFLTDHRGKTRSVFMGNLYHHDWKILRWDNPNYITTVRNRVLQRSPLYPWDIPLIKLESIMLSRHMDEPGGDFVTYIKDIVVTYDLAIDLETKAAEDIDDEAVWGILKEVNQNRKQVEAKKIKELNYLIEYEKATMHKVDTEETQPVAPPPPPPPTPTPTPAKPTEAPSP